MTIPKVSTALKLQQQQILAPRSPALPGAGLKLWSETEMTAGGGLVHLREQTGIAIAAHPPLAQVGISPD